ncbi:alpha/beta hydrolase [Streptomyces sp. NPDC005648]|uniref:alpha/beta fold hydrolase n=1 Tax=Streptomyces sp. NPDC005648 TaxID=3157044 RepID=UPI0033A6215E
MQSEPAAAAPGAVVGVDQGVEAVDLPGFGDSPPPDDGDYSVTGHARAVIRHLDAAGRGPVHLFGNSLGGAVSTRVAALRPDLVRTLTLVSPALPEILVQRSAVPTALMAVPGVTGLFARYTRGWTAEQRVGGVTALCYGDPGRVTPEGFRHAVEEMERRLQLPYFWDAMTRSARGIVNAYTLGGQQNLWRQAERVLAPTLLVYGGRDQLVGYRMARKAARSFRDSRLLTLPDAGHVAMMEYPETVARAFVELLGESGESPDGAVAGAVMGARRRGAAADGGAVVGGRSRAAAADAAAVVGGRSGTATAEAAADSDGRGGESAAEGADATGGVGATEGAEGADRQKRVADADGTVAESAGS